MVIFDTENNYNGEIKGMLYISLMDADYLVKKYGIKYLKEMIPEDYVDYFLEELRKCDEEDALSLQYYSILSLGIENESDERLLSLIKQEVEMNNLFPKKQLAKLSLEELEKIIEEMKDKDFELLSLEEQYKLRSYMMARFIINSINNVNVSVDKVYEGINVLNAKRTIIDGNKNFEAMGLSGSVKESDYFDKAIMVAKRLMGDKFEKIYNI